MSNFIVQFFQRFNPFKERIHITGYVDLLGITNGKVVLRKRVYNAVTNAGFDLVCNQIGLASQPNEIAWMAIGNGVAGNTAAESLTSETDRQAATYAHTHGTKTCTFAATFTTVAAATEYGLLNAASNGELLNTAGFASISVDSLIITATLTLS